MKKLKLLVVAVISILLLPLSINAADKEPINVYIFKGDGCGYCAAALEYFESIEKEYGKYFNLVEYEVWNNTDNASLMTDVASYFGEEVGGVPYIVIGDKTFQGYAESYNDQITDAIKAAYNNEDYVDAVKAVGNGETSSPDKKEENDENKTTIIIISVALIGFVALFYFARDTETDEVEVKEVKKEVVEEPKKTTAKKASTKTTATKKTTTTKKATNNTKKTTSSSAAKKTTAKKTTSAKKTTKK